jgi:hypothetical protein
LSPVLYGPEPSPLLLRGEHGPRVFENRALNGIYRPKRDEVTGVRRDVNNKELLMSL